MKKGYVLIDIIVSLACILILSLAIIKSIDTIQKDNIKYNKDKELIRVIEQVKDYIKDTTDKIETDIRIKDYNITIRSEKEIVKDELYKYKVSIFSNSDKKLKSEYYIIKKTR